MRINRTMQWPVASVVAGCLMLLGTGLGATAEADIRRDAAVGAVARVMPSVVNIGTEEVVDVSDPWDQMLREFWGPYHRRSRQQVRYSLGSGVIIDEGGYVLTNDHVVRRASRVWVKLSDEAGAKEYEAEVVKGTSRTDVALLKIKAEEGERFTASRFAADDDLLLGETVLALGNPFGLGGSVSRGILSSKSRRPPEESMPLRVEDWLQTDAAINPGNSGGPLINLRGEVIGLSVAVYREGQGIGFAIPIKRVTAALSDIVSSGLNELWLGARIRPGNPLAISAIEPDSPASRAGLQAGDVIASVNEKTPGGYIDFIQELGRNGDRRELVLGVQRNGARQTARVRLVKKSSLFNAALIKQKLGLSVQDVTPDLAEQMGLLTQDGLLVAGVDRESPAAEAGLQRGFVILGVDSGPAEDVTTTAKVLYGKKKGDKVSLQILAQQRRGNFVIPRQGKVELDVR